MFTEEISGFGGSEANQTNSFYHDHSIYNDNVYLQL